MIGTTNQNQEQTVQSTLQSTATKSKTKAGASLADVTSHLLKAHIAGKNVYVEFDGIKLYSCDILPILNRWLEERKNEEAQANIIANAIDGWVVAGLPFLKPNLEDSWRETVKNHVTSHSPCHIIEWAITAFQGWKRNDIGYAVFSLKIFPYFKFYSFEYNQMMKIIETYFVDYPHFKIELEMYLDYNQNKI